MFRWIIYERCSDGTQYAHLTAAPDELYKIGVRWGVGSVFTSEKTARLFLAWLAVVYYIQDHKCRNVTVLKEVFDNAFNNKGFSAWNVHLCGDSKYFIRPICRFEKESYYDDPIDPNTISFPSVEEGLKNAIEKVY